jgi:serine/threonine protein kinase
MRGAALLVALSFLALTGATVVVLAHAGSGRAAERRADDARAAGLRAADAVQTLLGSLEAQVQNATSNPRLVAALDAKVDATTLGDLLLNEPWWESFRRAVDGFALYGADAQPVVGSRLPADFDARAVIREARQAGRARSALVTADGQVLLTSAAPVALVGRSTEPALLAVRALDAGVLDGAAQRAGAVLALSNGHELLVTSSANPGTGTVTGGAALADAQALSTSEIATFDGFVVAARGLGGDGTSDSRSDLKILAAVPAPGGIALAQLPNGGLAILIVGILLSLGSFAALSARRGPRRKGGLRDTRTDGPAHVGRYTLVSRIGEGGMAEIYSAVTTGAGTFRRPVVIKRLKPELAADPAAVAQFRDEANLLAAFNHPNIVAVHDFGQWENRFFLAEEYVAGRNLGRIIDQCFRRDGRPPALELVAYVAREVLKALDYAHRLENGQGRPLKIVHRDISPENVVVTAQGEVKLLDFGIVKAAEGRVTKTEIGMVKGNVTFMAPEQARGLDVDGRADLYSLALVLFYCCTGTPLYTAEGVYERLMQAAMGPGPTDRELIQRLPKPFSTVIQRATDPDLNRRYPTAREMAADLKNWALHGATPTALLVNELFGDELKEEARRLATCPAVESQELVSYSSSDR